MSETLAYGLWFTEDGAIVVFDRSYRPFLVRRFKNSKPERCPPHWVRDIKQEVHLWTDGTPEKMKSIISKNILDCFGEIDP